MAFTRRCHLFFALRQQQQQSAAQTLAGPQTTAAMRKIIIRRADTPERYHIRKLDTHKRYVPHANGFAIYVHVYLHNHTVRNYALEHFSVLDV